MPVDGVSLEDASRVNLAPCLGVKPCLILFALFLAVTSNVFVESVVAKIDGATRGRDPTFTGALVQGLCLVLGYVATLHLIDNGLI